jgi:hypothetical protein
LRQSALSEDELLRLWYFDAPPEAFAVILSAAKNPSRRPAQHLIFALPACAPCGNFLGAAAAF